MSVYNGEKYLPEAIESILNQTFKEFEFLIIDDGSTDRSRNIIKSYKDPRIKLITQKNHGLTFSLNEGVKLSGANLIARMDADDISLPTRLEKQLNFLQKNPQVVLVGTAHFLMDIDGKVLQEELVPTKNKDITRSLFVRNVFAHGSVIFRKPDVIKAEIYLEDEGSAEDYGLWSRLSQLGEVANLEEALYKWRINPIGVSLSNKARQNSFVKLVKDRFWAIGKPEKRGLDWAIRRASSADKYKDLHSELQGRIGREYSLRGDRLGGLGQVLLAILIHPTRPSNYVYIWSSLLSNKSYLKLEKLVDKLRGRS